MLHINYSKISLTEFDNIFYELREHHVIFTFKNDRIVHLLVVLKGS